MVNNRNWTRYFRHRSAQRDAIRNRFLSNESGSIDWMASLRYATPNQDQLQRKKYSLTKIVKRPGYPSINHLNIILLDTSASTLSGSALQQSKAIVAAINNRAYVRRERLALIIFGNNQVKMQIPPSKPRKSLHNILNEVPAGGGTPFRPALIYVKQLLEHRRLQQQAETSAVYILTDGRSRADVSDIGLETKTMIIDTECGPIRLNRCYAIAQQWQADYIHMDSIP